MHTSTRIGGSTSGRRFAGRTATLLVATLGALGACGPVAGGDAPATGGHANGGAAAGAQPNRGPGVPADSVRCDQFPATDLQNVVATRVPTARLQAADPGPDAATRGGRLCRFTISTPGTDLTSADRGLAELSVQISDSWGDSPLDGKHDSEENQRDFASNRSSAQATYNGSTENGAKGQYYDAPGVGAGAFLEDVVHVNDDGTVGQLTTDLSALHDPRPFRVEVGISYVLPQADQELPDRSLDAALHDQPGRAALVEAVARAILAKIG